MSYDIFICYRREGGAQYARIMQLMLQQRGYKVFLDYDELTDGIFGEHIKKAIIDAPIFMLILSENSLDRCMNDTDWVRQEIMLAINNNKPVIPINPDNKFKGLPEDKNDKFLPVEIREYIGKNQHSEVGFGQTLGVTIDLMIEKRIIPKLGSRSTSSDLDVDFESAKETLQKMDRQSLSRKRIWRIMAVLASLVSILIVCLYLIFDRAEKENQRLRSELHGKYKSFGLYLSSNLTQSQMHSIESILQTMVEVKPGHLWMSKFEFTEGQWHGLLNESYDVERGNLPKVNISFGEVYLFLLKLSDMTNIEFALPSADEWEYAARGGKYEENTLYAGSEDPDDVAWYINNSGGKIHPSDGLQGKEPNILDMYDMSGNVSELCNTPYDSDDRYIVCGGNYNSTRDELSTAFRAPFSIDSRDKTVGFRIILRMNDN